MNNSDSIDNATIDRPERRISVNTGFSTIPGMPAVHCVFREHLRLTDNSDSPRSPVILFSPLFEERKNSKRALFRFIKTLTDAHHPVYSFDYPNASESFDDGSPFEIEKAVSASLILSKSIINISPNRNIIFMGVRFGATIASSIARVISEADTTIVPELLLISPIVSGINYARQIKQRRLVRRSISTGKSQSDSIGDSDYDGYVISDSTFSYISEIDIFRELRELQSQSSLTWLNFGHKNELDDSVKSALSNVKCTVKSSSFRFPPFWDRIGDIDLTPLCDQLRLFL